MKKLVQGSIIRIPLLENLGYAYAQYIDLSKFDRSVRMPDAIKCYDTFSNDKKQEVSFLKDSKFLLNPILVAGLRPELKRGNWEIIGNLPLKDSDQNLPDFKSGNETYEEINLGRWYRIRNLDIGSKTETSFEAVKYLQPYVGVGTGNVEIRLTMYALQKQGRNVEEFFDLSDDTFKWNYIQIKGSQMLVS